jgi:HK97 gp10 family phage protein
MAGEDRFVRHRKLLREAVEHAVTAVATKIHERAEDLAPVRKVFKEGGAGKGVRSRALSKAETIAELPLRLQLALPDQQYKTIEAKRRAIKRKPAIIRTADTRRSKAQLFNPDLAEHLAPAFVRARREALLAAETDPDAAIPNARELGHLFTGGATLEHFPTQSGERAVLTSKGRYELHSRRAESRSRLLFKFDENTGETKLTRVQATPTLGGTLKREIYLDMLYRGRRYISRAVISPTYYARFVEFGTRHNKAQPYLRPAVAEAREHFRKILNDQLELAYKDLKRGTHRRRARGTQVGTVRHTPARLPSSNRQPIKGIEQILADLQRKTHPRGGSGI